MTARRVFHLESVDVIFLLAAQSSTRHDKPGSSTLQLQAQSAMVFRSQRFETLWGDSNDLVWEKSTSNFFGQEERSQRQILNNFALNDFPRSPLIQGVPNR